MKDIAKARSLFKRAGLAFPVLPKNLASSLKERGKWLYATCSVKISPYDLNHYVNEARNTPTDDYAVLSHSGHGVNSYAIQYYLVWGHLRMFLFLGWGGVYMDNQKAVTQIQECFHLADRIVTAAASKLPLASQLSVVVSDFYGSYWSQDNKSAAIRLSDEKTPQQILGEVLVWLEGRNCQR